MPVLFAGWLGYKPPEKKPNDLSELLKVLGGAPGLEIDARIFEAAEGSA